MGRITVLALRVVIAMLLAGSLLIQTVMVPLLSADMDEAGGELGHLRIPVSLIVLLGLLSVEVVLVCVWRLVTMARLGTVFSFEAFRHVDIVMTAVVAAAVLVFSLGFVLAPGEAVAPGIVLMIGGAGVAVLGVALIVLVLRTLLSQAVARDVEAARMQAELDEVI
ncbi:DUF2975 domain-containing protein [Streptomyces sp. NBC_00178]|uniref:DUF2975 domain-containing protein n=1 Tax=Streptomyces sp. NBC_00178 TaxID=2975672 RepID=UPI002E2961DE|nr:DUF2975 domain-containing protein [Streptomyces sp. NBC_00178]